MRAGARAALVRNSILEVLSAGKGGVKDARQKENGHDRDDKEGRSNNVHNANPLTDLA